MAVTPELPPLFPRGAVVVYGASGGIGGAVAREFARAGADVAAIYRTNRAAADQLAQEVLAFGRQVSLHRADIRDAAAVTGVMEAATRTHGRVHTVVLGAGPIVRQVYLSQVEPAQWREAVDTELHGCWNAIQAALPHLRAAGGGSFVHLGSAGCLRWPNKDGLSVAPKAANEALIRGIAREEGRYGVRANSVLVGVIAAGMFQRLSAQGAFPEQWAAETLKALAIKRWGGAEEIGHTAVFLASSRAAYVTGQQIAVAGGYGI
jgi:3-oxoacyl-[acyl-carrier protein] reductase